MRYIDDFVLCLQYRADALRVQEVLRKRLGKFRFSPGTEQDQNLSNFVAMRNDTRASVAVSARRRFTFWASHCILHPQSERQLSGSAAYGEVTLQRINALPEQDPVVQLPLRAPARPPDQMLRGHYAFYGITRIFRALQQSIEPWSVRRAKYCGRSWKDDLVEVSSRSRSNFRCCNPSCCLSLPGGPTIATL